MAEITAEMVKKLREITGAGMMDCKGALGECFGDLDKAVDVLRTKGLADLAKKAGRAANEGLVESYIHMNGRIGVLLEVNCETDFVARNDEFKAFAHDVAMHIAAANPRWIVREDADAAEVEHEKAIYAEQAAQTGKPQQVTDKIVAGKLDKFFQQTCLLEQPFVKDDSITVEKYLGSVVGKLGENIKISRFCRFGIGEA
jgi:elongation factor Ts